MTVLTNFREQDHRCSLYDGVLLEAKLLQEQIMVYKVTALWIILFFFSAYVEKDASGNGIAVFLKQI